MEVEIIRYKTKKKKRKAHISKLTGRPLISRQKAQKKLDVAFNAFIRARDKRCLMGVMFGGCKGYLTAGHVVPKEDSINVRWIEDNVFGQCSGHNYNHRYHRSKYNTWFMATHGQERFMEISKLASEPPQTPTTAECLVLTAYYEKLTRNL